MSLSTRFDGDPESCWRAARRLDGLAEAVERSGHFLARQAGLPPDDFEGLSGNAYRDSAGRLHGEAMAAAGAERALAVALDGFATSLDDVRRVLGRAHALARDNLVVAGPEIEPPGPDATERQREVFRMVEGAVGEARRVEDQAHHDWQAALARHTGTPAPPPLAVGPTGLPSPHPLPGPLPDAGTAPLAPVPPPVAPLSSPGTPLLPAAVAAGDRGGGGDDWAPPPTGTDWAPAPPPAPALISWEVPDGPR